MNTAAPPSEPVCWQRLTMGWRGVWVVLWLSGCSTIMNGLEQSITVTAEERDELECHFVRNGQEWPVPEIPGTVMVRKSSAPITLKCEKKDFEPYVVDLKPMYDGFAAENIFLGLGVSLVWVAVDEALSSHWSYPDHVEVVLKPVSQSKTRKTYMRRKRRQGQEETAPPPEESQANTIYNEYRRAFWYEQDDDPEVIVKSLGKALPPAMKAPSR